MISSLQQLSGSTTSRYPVAILILVAILVAISSTFIRDINIDASPDSLLLENDEDLKYYREIRKTYGTDEYIIIGYSPRKYVFAPNSIEFIDELTRQLGELEYVDAVTSITTVPLIQQLDPSGRSSTAFLNLTSPSVNIDEAEEEFASSPVYSNNLMSDDFKTTALVVNLSSNEALEKLIQERYVLLDIRDNGGLSEAEQVELEEINQEIQQQRSVSYAQYASVLNGIRATLAEHEAQGTFYLAGGPLIANDMRDFVNRDIQVFGIAIIAIMFIVLLMFFRKIAWVFLPLICAALNVVLVAGLIGLIGIQITIISANFIALLIISSTALAIHVIVRYQEVAANGGDLASNVRKSVEQIMRPCLYMVLTSAIAFFSLVVSDIKPVIDFGYVMIMGLFSAFFITFTVLPSLIMLVNPDVGADANQGAIRRLMWLLKLVLEKKNLTVTVLLIMLGLSVLGLTQITVENRFIDYFKQNTDIYKGLVLIDENLGGTAPLEVLLEVDAKPIETVEEDTSEDEFDDYLTELEQTEDDFTSQSYWYNRRGIEKIHAIHRYLEQFPQIGKVSSLSSTEEVFRVVNKGEKLENFHLSLVYKKSPELIKNVLINPYVSPDGNQARIVARVKDSDHSLVRNDLLNQLEQELSEQFVSSGESVRLSGISVLYNNVLQSLYRSQILTLGTVFVFILGMLIVLFRNVLLAIIGTLPNIFTAFFVLGMMGLLGIPLDIMTITIAAITIGVGVDYAIHYIHRFKDEFARTGDYEQSITKVQTTVGRALYFTSLTITLGFIILVTSNFMPSVYFGLFTSAAMLVSLLVTFSLIPLLMMLLKPIKKAAA